MFFHNREREVNGSSAIEHIFYTREHKRVYIAMVKTLGKVLMVRREIFTVTGYKLET